MNIIFSIIYYLIVDILVFTQRTVLWIATRMINKMMFFKCLHSPALFLGYNMMRDRWERYNPNEFEVFGERCLIFIKFCIKYTSPFWLYYLYRRDYFTLEGMMTLTKISVALGVTLTTSYCIRSYGRLTNPRYIKFIKVLEDGSSPLKEIKQYDFEFSSWPVEYEYNHALAVPRKDETASWRSTAASLIKSPCSIIGYVVLHTFGIRMIYPGSTSIINFILFNALLDGRKALLESKKGTRYKIKTKDNNYIDTMFVNKRAKNEGNAKGNILVICSEGNAGFYENGIMTTAIEAGYSVLGWNHPGFGCSTGMPYLDQEQNAIETVMQFAIHKLGFEEKQIILYGWSIGGYATTWAARHYGNVKAVVLDATFDDILPLAINQMPQLLEPLVKMTIRCYADLNVAANLAEFQGSVKLIRRSQDEIISTDPGNIATNRGNMLLSKLLKRRYPALISTSTEGVLYQWLNITAADQDRLLDEYRVNRMECKEILRRYQQQYGPKYPFSLGDGLNDEEKTRLLLYLADSYMTDYDANHVTMLPSSVFENITAEL